MMMNDMSGAGGMFAGAFVIFAIMGLLSFVLGIILLVSMMKLFKKAGKNMWYSLIPVYNLIVLMDIIKMDYKELLFLLIPIVGSFIFLYKYSVNLSKAFGKSNSFAWGLFFLSFIFIPLLAFSDDKYVYGGSENNVINNVVFNPVGTSNSNNDQLLTNNSMELVNAIPSDMVVNQNEEAVAQVETVSEPVQVVEPASSMVAPMESIPTVPVSEPTQVVEQIETVAPMESIPTVPVEVVDNKSDDLVENIIPIVATESSDSIQKQNSIIKDEVPTETVEDIPAILELGDGIQENTIPNVAEVISTANSDNNSVEAISFNEGNSGDNSGKNLCKNCGSVMPNIVTICPNCGTDNE